MRVLQIALPPGGATLARGRNAHDVKRVGSGLLMQTADNREIGARRPEGRDAARSRRRQQIARPAVRLEGRQVREEQRDRLLRATA